MHHKPTLVILGADAALHAACRAALAGHTDVFYEGQAERPYRPDFVLVPLRDPLLACVERFAIQRRIQPDVPLLLCGADVAAEVAVELIKAGAVDFVGLPIAPEVLRRKLDRARSGRYVSVLDEPALAPLRTSQGEEGQAPGLNRRRCFRVQVPSHLALVLSSPKLGENVRIPVEDLSVKMDGQAGGMRLRADAAVVARLLALGGEVPVSIHLPGPGPGEGQVLPGHIHLLRMNAGVTGAHVVLGVQYRLTHHRDEEKLERLWMQCQRQLKTSIRPAH